MARSSGLNSAVYLRLYALEGFLLRLAQSRHRDQLILKGGVLLAAYDLRRATTDIDFAALHTGGEIEQVRRLVCDVAATPLPVALDDGLQFHAERATAEPIRESAEYAGVRVHLQAALASAREPFHIDVNLGDPIQPKPSITELPRLLGGDSISLRA